MQPSIDTDYKQLFSQLIKKQMLILGPDITLAKVKNVVGITVEPNGDVIAIQGDPQQLLQALINQFVELSGMIVKKTMESVLTSYPGMVGMASPSAFGAEIVSAVTPPSQVTEPPPMDIVAGTPISITPLHVDAPPKEPSSNEMTELNKALEDLSREPLTSEQAATPPSQQ